MLTPTVARTRGRLGALVATTALTLGSLAATVAPADAAISAPANLKASHLATKGVGLTWNTAGEDAYRVRIATNAAMTSGTDTWDTIGNYLEWTHTDPNPSVTSARLTPGKTYYFQVKAVKHSATDRSDLSAYSKPVAITLPKTGLPELKPVQLKTTPGGADSMYVSWRSRGPGVSYVLRYTTDPSAAVLKWKSVKFNTAGGAVTGLQPGKEYWFRTRAIDAKGVGVSAYSDSGVSGTTASSTPSPGLSVISYNIRKAYAGTTWATRRKPVAANILAQQPDVLGLQEATPGTDGTADGKKQYDDILDLLGPDYALTTRTGSSGTKLVYNTKRLTASGVGVKQLSAYGSALRYASWATFKDTLSGKSFFVINTHLEPGSNSSSTLNTVRIQQAEEVLGLINANAGGRPVMILGDMNSSRAAKPTNGQYVTFTGAGYIDPLDNATGTWTSGANSISEHLLDVQYSSFNNLERKARQTSFPVGTLADYIYVSRDVRVAMWRTVVSLDTSGNFVGTIPSDHNLLATTVHLP